MSGTSLRKSITLEINRIEHPFNSFWLKSVEDVDLSKHCINCLKGERVPIRQEHGYSLALSPRVWYLCGVTYPYIWEDNFHLAFQYCPGNKVYIKRKGVVLTLNDAEEIPITDEYIDWELPQAKDASFRTCRNWQFANYFVKKYGKKQQTLF